MADFKRRAKIKQRIEREAENQRIDAMMRLCLGFGESELKAALRRHRRHDILGGPRG